MNHKWFKNTAIKQHKTTDPPTQVIQKLSHNISVVTYGIKPQTHIVQFSTLNYVSIQANYIKNN